MDIYYIFEEGGFISTPFQEGFGLQTIHGIPKPSYDHLNYYIELEIKDF